jgi:hypothetical protein
MKICLITKKVIFLLFVIPFIVLNICIAGNPIKFAGITMGMKSEELINKILSQEDLTAFTYDGGDRVLSIGDILQLYVNTDTIGESYLNNFRFNCFSYILGTPNELYNPTFSDYPPNKRFNKLIFHNWEIIYPNFIFINNSLVSFYGTINMKSGVEYLDLVDGLNKKYGKGTYKYPKTIWRSNNAVFSINGPISIKDNYVKNPVSCYFEFNDQNQIDLCFKRKKYVFESEQNNILIIDNKKIKLLGLSIGMSKQEAFNILSDKYKEDLLGYNHKSNGSTFLIKKLNQVSNSNEIKYTDEGWPIVYNPSFLPDSFLLELPFKDYKIEVLIGINDNKISSVRVGRSGYSPYSGKDIDFYNSIFNKFYDNNKSVLHRVANKKNGMIIDQIACLLNSDSLSMNYINYAHSAYISLFNSNNSKKQISDENNLIDNEVLYLLQSIDQGKILGLTVGGNYECNENEIVDNNTQLVNFNQSNNSSVICMKISRNITVQQSVYKTDGSIHHIWNPNSSPPYYEDAHEKYCCGSDFIEILIKGGRINSISSCILPVNYKDFTLLKNSKSEIVSNITKQLNNKYGKGKEKIYSGRKSLYWIINDYIFELILEYKTIPQRINIHQNINNLVAFYCLREKTASDFILKIDSKKGLLD